MVRDSSEDALEEFILAHPKSWTQHELLENIVARYFHIQSKKGGRWPTFSIQCKEEHDNSDLLHESLNHHLFKLGWMSKILEDEPFTLIVFPTPERQFPSVKTKSLFWIISFCTVLLAGSLFLEPRVQSSSDRMIQSLFFYTVPIMFVLIVANQIQKSIAKKYGVRLGPILPIPDPSIVLFYFGILPNSLLLWPFGILFLPTLPRMDARPWPNRYSLGISSIAAPVVFFVSGCISFLMGLLLTLDFVAVQSTPYVIQPPLFIEFLSQFFTSSNPSVLYAWSHPLIYVGMFFLLLSWVLLLPVPTFPGGRIMISRMGMVEARSSSTQTFLLLIFLVFAMLYDVFSSFGMWFLILSICLPLIFFYGSDLRSPFISNEILELNDSQHRKLGTFLLLIFILALPNPMPLGLNDSWDDPLILHSSELNLATLLEDGTWVSTTQFDVENPSAIEQRFILSAYLNHDVNSWNMQWNCAGEDTYSHDGQGCGADVKPGYIHRFWLNLTWDSIHTPYATEVIFVIQFNEDIQYVSESLKPSSSMYTSDMWIRNSTVGNEQWCTQLHASSIHQELYNISIEYLSIEDFQSDALRIDGVLSNSTSFEKLPDTICMNGLDELIFSVTNPTLRINNQTFSPMYPPLRSLEMIIPSEGWLLSNVNSRPWGSFFEPNHILANQQECPINPVVGVPTQPSQGDWVWNANIRPIARIPDIENAPNLTLLIEPNTPISICDTAYNPHPQYEMNVVEGPELLVQWQGGTTRLWTTPWFVGLQGTFFASENGNITIHNPNTEEIPFRLSFSGDGERWVLPEELIANSTLSPGVHHFQLTPPTTPYSAFWLSHQSGEVVFHFTSYR